MTVKWFRLGLTERPYEGGISQGCAVVNLLKRLLGNPSVKNLSRNSDYVERALVR